MDKVKLVIWDLDETIWEGVLAEGEVRLKTDIINVIRELNSRGIVNSICSKNDFQNAKEKLCELNIWELFVFPVISYAPKGDIVKTIISDMSLRAQNVVFVDDNISNQEEVKFYNQGITTLFPDDISDDLLNQEIFKGYTSGKSQLEKYRMLENKREQKRNYKNNTDFLFASNIKVELIEYQEKYFSRVLELVEKTNQLNFTKNRMSAEELEKLLLDAAIEKKLVRVEDIFGDYGVVGFFALQANELIHFVFSCRIMNMGIEQYIYHYLNEPQIRIIGDVASKLDDTCADWVSCIGQKKVQMGLDKASVYKLIGEKNIINILGIGACDLLHSVSYLQGIGINLTYRCNEFKGMERAVNVGTEYIRSTYDMTSDEKKYCKEHFYNYTNAFNGDGIFNDKYDIFIMSFHDDMVFKIFRSLWDENLRVVRTDNPAYGLTSIIEGEMVVPHDREKDWLEKNGFDNGKFISEERLYENLLWISSKAKGKKVYLINGPEYPYFRVYMKKNKEIFDQIKKINQVLLDICREYPNNFVLIDINNVIKSRDDFTDYVFHLSAKASYALYKEILNAICDNEDFSNRSFLKQYVNGRDVCVVGDELNNSIVIDKIRLYSDDIHECISSDEFIKRIKKQTDYYIFSSEKEYELFHEELERLGRMELVDFIVITSDKEDSDCVAGNDVKPIEMNTLIGNTWDDCLKALSDKKFVVWGVGRGKGLNILDEKLGLQSMIGAIDSDPCLQGMDVRYLLNNENYSNKEPITIKSPMSITEFDKEIAIIITAMNATESIKESIKELCDDKHVVFSVSEMENNQNRGVINGCN